MPVCSCACMASARLFVLASFGVLVKATYVTVAQSSVLLDGSEGPPGSPARRAYDETLSAEVAVVLGLVYNESGVIRYGVSVRKCVSSVHLPAPRRAPK